MAKTVTCSEENFFAYWHKNPDRWARVAIFRQKNFPWNTEQADGTFVGFPPVSRKRKISEFCTEPFLGREKPSEFIIGILFFLNHFWKRKNLGKRQFLLAASLNFIISRNSVQFCFVLSYGMDSSEILGITWNEHFIPRNNKNRSKSIPRNFSERNSDGNPKVDLPCQRARRRQQQNPPGAMKLFYAAWRHPPPPRTTVTLTMLFDQLIIRKRFS